jgi:hypothetical protein
MMAYAAGRLASGEGNRVVLVEPAAVTSTVATAKPLPATQAPAASIEKPTVKVVDNRSAVGGSVNNAIAKASPVVPLVADKAPVQLSYWQVASVERGMAEVSKKYLEEKKLPVKLEPVEGSILVRVLVGPALDSQVKDYKQKLDSLGFTPFLKKY